MRTELAVGQFADLINDARQMPGLEVVLDVARRKSGNYTVRRPLEIGAAMGGCDDRTLSQLGRYGAAVGEAFQLRDDVLGVFGSPAITGKPCAGDLLERKATSLVVAAHQLADAPVRRELYELANRETLDDTAIARWKALIVETGAVRLIEEMIGDRIASACEHLGDLPIEGPVRTALAEMAAVCTDRAE
jgi:geranylgeranyl diphosphate synthase type I